ELDDFESSLDTSTFGPINTTNFPSETLFSIGGAKDPLFGLSEVDKICHRKEIERLNRERAEKLKKE
ncbi:hypothetical protein EBR77_04315, partial [bacterium]|nr:hypothetical protein [bacterium]